MLSVGRARMPGQALALVAGHRRQQLGRRDDAAHDLIAPLQLQGPLALVGEDQQRHAQRQRQRQQDDRDQLGGDGARPAQPHGRSGSTLRL